MRTRILKKTKSEMVFTTNISKVPSLNKCYKNKFDAISTKVNKSKSDIAKEKLNNLFS